MPPERVRRYRLGKREEHVERTRRRITEAAVRLHTSVGPSATSMAAVAEAASVTRLTLSRHFATKDALFDACMGHWRAAHPPPDPSAWREIRSFRDRVARAIADVYAWYAENAEDLYPIYRDAAFTPVSTLRARRSTTDRMVEVILEAAPDGGSVRRLRAALGHALVFWTWRSLAVEEGLSHSEAVSLARRFVLSSQAKG